jgi:hypothetical protein
MNKLALPTEPIFSLRADGRGIGRSLFSCAVAVSFPFLVAGCSASRKVPLCEDVQSTRPSCSTLLRVSRASGPEMVFTLPCAAAKPAKFADSDYYGETLSYRNGGNEYTLLTMQGATCCSGGPRADQYQSSQRWDKHSWYIETDNERFYGIDVRGASRDGTNWRWVGPSFGALVRYEGASVEAAKYFDAILDSMCIEVTH